MSREPRFAPSVTCKASLGSLDSLWPAPLAVEAALAQQSFEVR